MTNKNSISANTRKIIQQHNFDFKKRLGQNFLIDEFVLEEIAEGAQLSKDDYIIEIGPGIGSLTQKLAEYANEVLAVEIDTTLMPILKDTLADYDNVEILNEDVMKLDLKKIIKEKWGGKRVKVVANLPYYITTPIIMMLFENNIPLESITVMVQKEVGIRMEASPGTKDYGALSLAVQYYSEPTIVTEVPESCFIPQPKVGSIVVHLQRTDMNKSVYGNADWLFKIIRGSFQQRRKTLVNTLHNQRHLELDKSIIKEVLEEMGLSLTIRGEALHLNQFMDLAERLEKKRI